MRSWILGKSIPAAHSLFFAFLLLFALALFGPGQAFSESLQPAPPEEIGVSPAKLDDVAAGRGWTLSNRTASVVVEAKGRTGLQSPCRLASPLSPLTSGVSRLLSAVCHSQTKHSRNIPYTFSQFMRPGIRYDKGRS